MFLMRVLFVVMMTGTASQYAPGAMESVIRVRQAGLTRYSLPQEIPAYVDGFIAVEECDRIGETVVVVYKGFVETMMVADCSGHAETSSWMERNNILMEVGYETALRWGIVGRGAKVAVVTEIYRNQYK